MAGPFDISDPTDITQDPTAAAAANAAGMSADPFTASIYAQLGGFQPRQGRLEGLVNFFQRENAARNQGTILAAMNQQIADDMKNGTPPTQAMVNAFKRNPLFMVEHPELFEGATKMQQMLMAGVMKRQPGEEVVNGTTGQVVMPSEGAENAGKMTFQTSPDGQAIAILHDLSGNPSHVIDTSQMSAQQALALAQANEAMSTVPKNQAETALAKARAALFGGMAGNGNGGEESPIDKYIDAIGTYQQRAPAAGTQFGDLIRGRLAMKYPDWDETNWDAKHQIVTGYNNVSTSTAAGSKIRALNALLSTHLPALQQYYTALANGDVQKINEAKNKLATAFGSSPQTALNTASQIVGNEIMNYLQGARSGEGERLAMASNFGANLSPEQAQANLGVINDFLYGQAKALAQPANSVGSPQLFTRMLTPEVRQWYEARQAAEQGGGGVGPSRLGAGAATPAVSGPPQAAIQYLRQNPDTAAQFDAKYGPGMAKQFLKD